MGINNLKELQLKKESLQKNLTRGLDNPLSSIFSFLTVLYAGRTKSMKSNRNELIDEGAKTVLTLVAGTVASRLKLGKLPKMIITTGVTLATPFIVDFIQKKISSKKSK